MMLYVHIPFCVKKCDYCDFLSGPADREGQKVYVQALLREIQAVEERETEGVSSIFIGGGTPSILPSGDIGRIMEELNKKFPVAPDAEITIEANPGTLCKEKLDAYRAAGINRISMGLQSPDDGELRCLGRIHSWQQFLESFSMAREAGFSNINVDLMSAIPDQTYEKWVDNLRTVASLGPEHISAYSLIIEEGTPFSQRKLNLPDEDTEYRMYEDTAAVLAEYGYAQYEISNYAREGFSSRHNTGYWKRRDYLGFGLGAASLYRGRRFSNTRDWKLYVENSRFPERIREGEEILTREDAISEFMFLGLRMTEGVSREEFKKAFDCDIEEIYGPVLDKHRSLSLLEEKAGRIFLTRKGIHVSNQVMADFLLEE